MDSGDSAAQKSPLRLYKLYHFGQIHWGWFTPQPSAHLPRLDRRPDHQFHPRSGTGSTSRPYSVGANFRTRVNSYESCFQCLPLTLFFVLWNIHPALEFWTLLDRVSWFICTILCAAECQICFDFQQHARYLFQLEFFNGVHHCVF